MTIAKDRSKVSREGSNGSKEGRRGQHHEAPALEIPRRAESRPKRQRHEEDLSAFFENACIGLHWLGPDGLIQWANKADFDLLGYTAEEKWRSRKWMWKALSRIAGVDK